MSFERNPETRFWSKVDRSGGFFACWRWTASCDKHGYGQIAGREFIGERRPAKAHRVAYEFLVGPIPADHELDHLCRNTSCVNPAHLEPVTHAENVRRGSGGLIQRSRTHCPQRHAYDETNVRWYRGRRYCRACQREADRRRFPNAPRNRGIAA